MAVHDVQGVLQAAAGFVVQFGDGFFEEFEGVAQVAALVVQAAVFGVGAVVVGDGGEVYGAEGFHLLFEAADLGGQGGFVRRVGIVHVQRFAVVGEEFGGDALELLLEVCEVFLVVVQAFFCQGALVLALAQGFLFAVQVVRLFFDGAGGLRAGLFVLLVGFFEVFVAQVFFFEFEGERFALFLQGGEGFFGVKAFGGEALCLFVTGGKVGAVLFERGFGGAVVVLLLLPAVVGVLVGLEGGAEGGFQGGNGRQGGKGGGGKVGFFLGLLLLAAGGGEVFGEGFQGELLLGAQLGAVCLLLGDEGEAVREFALLLRGLLVLALLGGVGVAQTGELFGGGFSRFFEVLQGGFAFL